MQDVLLIASVLTHMAVNLFIYHTVFWILAYSASMLQLFTFLKT